MSQALDRPALAAAIAEHYAELPMVAAVALGGSAIGRGADELSDIDLYVYCLADIPRRARAAVVIPRAKVAEVDNRFWEPGDEWLELDGVHVDVMFRRPDWIQEQLDRVLVHHQATVGYSTCFWHNVLHSQALFDRDGWYAELQEQARQPYPEPLRRAVVAKNFPILGQNLSAYCRQLEKALARRDRVSVNHRVAALLASYFDILFAVNRLTHPGEKRLLELVAHRCDLRPESVVEQVESLLGAAPDDHLVLDRAGELVDGLERLLRAEGLLAGR